MYHFIYMAHMSIYLSDEIFATFYFSSDHINFLLAQSHPLNKQTTNIGAPEILILCRKYKLTGKIIVIITKCVYCVRFWWFVNGLLIYLLSRPHLSGTAQTFVIAPEHILHIRHSRQEYTYIDKKSNQRCF